MSVNRQANGKVSIKRYLSIHTDSRYQGMHVESGTYIQTREHYREQDEILYLLMTSHASFRLFTNCWFPKKHRKIIRTRN